MTSKLTAFVLVIFVGQLVAAQSFPFDSEEESSLANNFGHRYSGSIEQIDQMQDRQTGGGQSPAPGSLPQSSGPYLVGERGPLDLAHREPRPHHQHQMVRRQISYPNFDQFNPTQLQPPGLAPLQPQQQPQPQHDQGGVSKFFSELPAQMERVKAISTLLSGGSSQSSTGDGSSQSTGFNPSILMNQLTELIRSTQDRNAKMVDSSLRSVDQVGQQTASAAKQAQGGIQSALSEIGAGLQRLALNNPNLLPDIKNLYQSVSTKLSSASNSVAQATMPHTQKNGAEQFAEQLAKAGQ